MRRSAVLALATILAASCGQVTIEGQVVNPQGEALPGVVVQKGRGGSQDLTDVRGRYRLRLEPGANRLSYSKSGYTVAERDLNVPNARSMPVEDTTLWPLPLQPGVFLVENHRYRETQRFVPSRFYLADETVALGIEAEPRARITDPIPFILCYRTPRYDARLSRLVEAQASRPRSTSETFPVWVAGGTLAVSLKPIDQPNADLLRVAIDQPLEPGVYAVHWGALEGYNTLDNHLYVFELLPPPEDLPQPDVPPGAPESEEEPGSASDPPENTSDETA